MKTCEGRVNEIIYANKDFEKWISNTKTAWFHRECMCESDGVIYCQDAPIKK